MSPIPRSSVRPAVLLVALVLALGFAGRTSLARPTIRQSFFNSYPTAVGSRLDNLPSHATHCGVCHLDFNGGGTRNPYGNRLFAVIPSYANNDAGRQQAMHSVENEDSDADGFSTLVEVTNLTLYVNTPTFPGLTQANVGQTANVPNQSEITPYLVPTTGADLTPPTVTVISPNGGQNWAGGSSRLVTWTATDNVGVISVDLFYRDSESANWTMIARGLANTGSFQWFVHNTPTAAARVRVVAYDAAANPGADQSDAVFNITATTGGIVNTTLRDFHEPGTQPFGGGSFQDRSACMNCHGGYNPAVEPGYNFNGTMMGQAARDPLFYACLAVAEQDAPSAGDMCLRCHTPFGWMSGRSQPTSGSQLTALDRDGVACDFCHRAANPVYQPGVSPSEDQAVIAGLLPGHTPSNYSNGQYVIDPQARRRGPFSDTVAPHPVLTSPFHRSSDFCGTCHDVSNPVFNRVSGADYAPGPLDQAAAAMGSDVLLPLERTYSEWKHSAYPAGVYAPQFAGNKPGGMVASCQDCHLRDVSGKGCNDPAAPLRADLPLHDMMGGNSWMPPVVAALYPGETDAAALSDARSRALSMLQKAATLVLSVTPVGDSARADVTITNLSGHKLPTGYPEGRRMWLHVIARDIADRVVYESGAYESATGVLHEDPHPVVYEAELGVSPGLASALGLLAGPTFHFALNDTVLKDNRIPPLGFTNAAFGGFGGSPVDALWPGPGPRYADGQNWDIASFPLPSTAVSVEAQLFYQTTSKAYVEFLRDENSTNSAGLDMYNAWTANGRSAPVLMASAITPFGPVGVGGAPASLDRELTVLANPFHRTLELSLSLRAPAPVRLAVFAATGRRVAESDYGLLPPGTHRLAWDARDGLGNEVGAGVYWVRVEVAGRALTRQVVRLR